MGPAPKWCSFLDNLTEELESNPTSTVYDDYKFVTKSELETLGLANLVGTNVLRAYMHGYFMDIRLYKKAKLLNDPFNFEEFKNRKIKERLEAERENRVKVVRKLPVVNTELDKNFEINPDSEEFRLLNPVVQKNNEKRLKRKAVVVDSDDGDGDNDNGANSDVDSGKDESSSDDEHQWKAQIKEQYKKVS